MSATPQNAKLPQINPKAVPRTEPLRIITPSAPTSLHTYAQYLYHMHHCLYLPYLHSLPMHLIQTGLAFVKMEFVGARVLILECANGGGMQGRRGIIVNETQHKFWVVLRESDEEDELMQRVIEERRAAEGTEGLLEEDEMVREKTSLGTSLDGMLDARTTDSSFGKKRKRTDTDEQNHLPAKKARISAEESALQILNASTKRSRIVRVEKKGLVFEMEGLESLWEREKPAPSVAKNVEQNSKQQKVTLQNLAARNTTENAVTISTKDTLTSSTTITMDGDAGESVSTTTTNSTFISQTPNSTIVARTETTHSSHEAPVPNADNDKSGTTTSSSKASLQRKQKETLARRIIIHAEKLIMKPVDRSTKKYRS